jgi:hypothetical protein
LADRDDDNVHVLVFLNSLLLELLDDTLVDATALVDQVTGGGRLAGIDVADDDNVHVLLFLGHFVKCVRGVGVCENSAALYEELILQLIIDI